jgi:hypothetical protein
VFVAIEHQPIAVLLIPVVLAAKALYPTAVTATPVVLALNEQNPTAVLADAVLRIND